MKDYNPNEECEICNKPMVRITEDMVSNGAIWKCNGAYGKSTN